MGDREANRLITLMTALGRGYPMDKKAEILIVANNPQLLWL
jgi:hypothetical protein